MLNCHEATRLMSEAQDRTLTKKQQLSLKMHTLMCKACKNFENQLDILRLAARTYAKNKDAE